MSSQESKEDGGRGPKRGRKRGRRPGPLPTWYPRIPDALKQLEEPGELYVTRATLQTLLDISPRQALNLLHRWGASPIGKQLVMRRDTLAARLRLARQGKAFLEEEERRSRLVAELRRARSAPLRFAGPAQDVKIAGLPDGVEIGPGRLELRFDSPRQAVERLFALAQALVNDFGAFEREASLG